MGQRQAGTDAEATTIPMRHMLYAEPCPPEWEEAWAVLERVLQEIAAETERLGARLMIVSLPCAQLVDPDSWGNIQQQFPAMKQQNWDLERPERRLTAIAEQNHWLLCQLYPMFRTRASGERLFFGNVGHMNPRGHELTAELIAEFINAQRLLPEIESNDHAVR
jgi:hypothetical protein